MVMPNFNLAGTWVSLSAMYNGASLAILPTFEPAAFVAGVSAHRPTTVTGNVQKAVLRQELRGTQDDRSSVDPT
jgi:hypothetical protein